MIERTSEVVIGAVYQHIEGLRYRVNRLSLDATGYEKTGRVRKTVVYTQLDDGKYPAGTEWTRLESDFLRRISWEGKLVPIFSIVTEPNLS